MDPRPPDSYPQASGRAAPPPSSRLVPPIGPPEPVPAAPTRRPIGRILGTVATTLLVLGVLGVVFKIIVRPVPTTSSVVAGTSDSAAPNTASPTGEPSDPASPTGPAGSGMPQGDLPGWRQTFAEDFTAGSAEEDLTKRWYVYNGQPGGDPAGWFSPSHVSRSGGLLTIGAWRDNSPNGHIYVSGGMSNAKTFSQVYGLYKVRFKMDRGWGITYIIQLWPTDDHWPPEIDIVEDNGKDRKMTSATLHYGANDTKLHKELKGDWTGWHIAEVQWSPGRLVYRIDGKQWWLIENPNIPNTPMSVAIQTQASKCGGTWLGCPNSSTPARVNLQVDWVVAYAAQR